SSERANELRQFLTIGKANMDYLASIPCDQQQTNLFRTLTALVNEMSKAEGAKTLYVFSDLVEVSSVINLESRYARNPSLVLEDYDRIIQAFEQDAPLPDLTGITVILITPGASDLHLWVSRFWTQFLTVQGAESVVTKSSL
ncbi:MAG: hypothetical protein RIF46_07695, partial [Cyclobacteriaceae bacterium]